MSSKQEHESSVEIVGRLGRDPELKRTEGDKPYVKLFIATTERFERNGEPQERTEWHNATVWGEKAEQIAGQFKKGDSVALSGELRINSYEKDGGKNRVTEITVNDIQKNLDRLPPKNEIRIVGVLREDPKGREFGEGKQITTFSVATKTTVNGREREDWHNVTAWEDKALAARDLKKGDLVKIEGPLKHRTFDGDGGVKRKLSSVECQQFQVLERAQELTMAPKVRRGRKGAEQAM